MRLTGLLLTITLFAACKSEKERNIVGKWNAAQLVECDETVPIAFSSINLEFKSNGDYIFNSTLNVHEEGDFRIKNDHLYTLDKLRDKSIEKIVKIQHLAKDTLVLEMNYKGKEQWLTLVRANPVVAQPNASAVAVSNTTPPVPSPAANNATSAAVTNTPPPAATPAPTSPPAAEPAKKTAADIEREEKEAHAAYLKREAKRREEEADAERERKEKRAEYLKREEQREKEARAAYLKREAARKKEEAERKKKSKK